MRTIRITGTGSALPGRIVTNKELEQLVETSDEWIRERTGIAERHVSVGETVVTLASEAARKALEQAGKTAEEIDLILVASCSPEQYLPCCACQVQAAIGAVNALAFDVNAACSGFLFALNTADAYLRMGLAENALVIGSEVLSNWWIGRTGAAVFCSETEPGPWLWRDAGRSLGRWNTVTLCRRQRKGGRRRRRRNGYRQQAFWAGTALRWHRWRSPAMRSERTDNPICKDFSGKNGPKPADERQRTLYSDGWTGSVPVRHQAGATVHRGSTVRCRTYCAGY